jgi:hypothetical protein
MSGRRRQSRRQRVTKRRRSPHPDISNHPSEGNRPINCGPCRGPVGYQAPVPQHTNRLLYFPLRRFYV